MKRHKIEAILNEAGFIFIGVDGKEKTWLCEWLWEKDGKIILLRDGRTWYGKEFDHFFKIEMFNKEDIDKHYFSIKNRERIKSLKRLKELVIGKKFKVLNIPD